MTLPVSRVGAYDLIRRLGAGGMGEVYLARDSRLERDVAIKLLPAEFWRDPEALARFRREALTLASVNHPNVATIHGFEDTPNGGVALVLEFVEGESLAGRLERGPMTIPEALSVCAQVAEALEVAHERGVVHRDLKPANVMLAPRGLVKVLDFGLALHRGGLFGLRDHPGSGAPAAAPAAADGEPATPGPRTLDRVVAGTPGYMSPEQVLAGEQDERTDVFAFGCVLYECLTGARAFAGRDEWEVMAKVLNETPDPAALPERLPARIRELLDRCLEKDTGKRLRTMRAVRHEIEEVLGTRRASALRTGEKAVVAHNLPQQLTDFVGREAELERCRAELAQSRLLTLLGMGGSGKTRLALRLAETVLDEHPDGVWFTDLSVLRDGGRVVEAVAGAVGVREEPGQPLEGTLTAHLRERRALLVLDNSESVLDSCRAMVAALLSGCRELRILATSRESLGVAGERVHPVPPLGLPEPGSGDDPARSEAVQLFVARAKAARSDFALNGSTPAVVEICRRLDGIPLALELAAARVRVLSVEQILARLGDRFRLLTAAGKSGEERHQTLRAAIQWSADQLSEDEQALFRGLSVFVGSCSLESATGVCGEGLDEFDVLDRLQRLADRSLLVLARDAEGAARYRFLESVRHFASERLDVSGETAACRDRHLEWFLRVAERSEAAQPGETQKSWLARLDLDHEDLLAAHGWSAGREQGVAKGLRIAAALARFWSTRGHFRLARRTLTESLGRPRDGVPGTVLALALVRAAGFALYEGDHRAARPLLEESLLFYRDDGDERGVARSLAGLSTVAIYEGDYGAGRARLEETIAIYRRRNDRHALALALMNLGALALLAGDPVAARGTYEEAVLLLEGSGDDRHMALALGDLGLACLRTGDPGAARPRIAKALELARDLAAQREAAYALESTAELAEAGGEGALALGWLEAATSLREKIGSPLIPVEVERQKALRQRLEGRLGAATVEALRAGRALTLDQAMAGALSWLGAPLPTRSQPS